jgi:hypothetical protein
LFGDDIGEFASNQALLDLPKWLVDGYVAYAGQPWSTEKDDELKSAILSGRTILFTSSLLKNRYWPGMLSGIISARNTVKKILLTYYTSHVFTRT